MSACAHQPRLVHEAFVYASDEEFLGKVVPFLRDAVAAGQPAIAVLSPTKSVLLRDAVAEAADHISFIEATTFYRRPARAMAEYRRRLDAELSRPNVQLVRVIGELPFGPYAEQPTEWTRYEALINRAFAGYPAWVVCAFDARVLPEQVVADGLRTHPFVATGDQQRDPSAGYIETDEWVGRPLMLATDRAGVSDPFVRLTVTSEGDLDDARRLVAGAARAAGLAPRIVDDVAVAATELMRDGLRHGDGEVSVQVGRDGARWHCEVTDRDSSQALLGERIGLLIARLIGERVELAVGPGAHTVRLTFAGAAGARQRLLDAASELFYQNGISATGINTIISHSGVAKATFFHHFPAKDDLVIAWLQQPASHWLDRIRTELDAKTQSPASKLLTFFDLLGEWFAQDDFRGCAFQNAAAEVPQVAHPIRRATHVYRLEIQHYLRQLADDAGLSNPARTAEQLHLLAQGAIAIAVITRSPDAAKVARAAAKRILTTPKSPPA